MTTLTLTYPDGLKEVWVPKVVPPPPPPAGLFGRVRHDFELWHFPSEAYLRELGYPDPGKAGQGMSRPEHIELERLIALPPEERVNWKPIPAAGLPETVKAADSRFMPLTEAWQRFWFGLLKASKPGQTEAWYKARWASLTKGDRAFTNGKGWDSEHDGLAGYRDFINNVNPTSSPMKQETIITGGNYVRVLDNGAKTNVGGVPCYRVEALDGTKPPPLITRLSHPHLIFIASNSTRTPINGRAERAVTPFPQLDGADVPVPLMAGAAFIHIAAERIELLPAGAAVPRVYHP